MAVDALDPGPDGDYPFWPRDDSAGTYMPTGTTRHATPDGRRSWLVDLTKYDESGNPIDPDAQP